MNNDYEFLTYMWSHGLLPQTAYIESFLACDWNQFLTNCSRYFTQPTEECVAANNASYKYIPDCIPDVNPPTSCNHDIYVPTCHPGQEYNGEYNPCMYNWTPNYMNRAQLLQAIHVDKYYKI